MYARVLYKYIGTWGRRYGCARAFSQPQGTNHYFIFHFVYFNSPEERETLTRRTPEEGRENKREIALWHVILRRPQFFF